LATSAAGHFLNEIFVLDREVDFATNILSPIAHVAFKEFIDRLELSQVNFPLDQAIPVDLAQIFDSISRLDGINMLVSDTNSHSWDSEEDKEQYNKQNLTYANVLWAGLETFERV
jgi:hypothetical protein